MISILIPVFDYDCSALVRNLHAQGEAMRTAMGETFEIIVGDDASPRTHLLQSVRDACRMPNCRFLESSANLGRAKNRNRMAAYAAGDKLLFIDCDAEVCRNDFLLRYIEAAKRNDVVCGGIIAPARLPSPNVSLRYKYERAAWKVRTLEYRRKHTYMHFSTFNFMIRRTVFERIRFDENCREYGYEDALFGLRLLQSGIKVGHIDNPLVHAGLDSNECFVDKCEQAMRTLKRLDDDIKRFSHVGATAMKLDKLGVTPAVKAFHRFFARIERANLLGRHPLLLVLKIYKLGYYCSTD